jgi:hypothetical protein
LRAQAFNGARAQLGLGHGRSYKIRIVVGAGSLAGGHHAGWVVGKELVNQGSSSLRQQGGGLAHDPTLSHR